MGGGVVLEQGTHQELLRNTDGAYSRLVQAQKLREQEAQQAAVGGSDTESLDSEHKMEKEVADEVPLGRKESGRSLGSEIIEKQQKERAAAENKDDYSLPYLFKRFGVINREGWKNYALGFVFACMTGAVYPCFGEEFHVAGSTSPD